MRRQGRRGAGWNAIERGEPRRLTGYSLVALWRADRGVTLNGSNVASISDQSGNGLTASQGNAANQPAYTTSGINGGRPAIDWSAGAANRGFATASVALGVHTIFGVIQGLSNSGYVVVHNIDAGDGGYVYCLTGASFSSARASVRSSRNVNATWLSDGVARSLAVVFDGTHAGHLAYRNGVVDSASSLLSNNPGTATQAGAIYIGMSQTGAGPYKGKMGELGIFAGAIPAAVAKRISNRQRALWKY